MSDNYAEEQRRNKEFKAYLDSYAQRVPEIAARVFALRGKAHGQRWHLERALGKFITSVNDLENERYWGWGREVFAARICVEIGIEGFLADLERCEAEVACDETDRRVRKALAKLDA